jgi:hypothetical protein
MGSVEKQELITLQNGFCGETRADHITEWVLWRNKS